jgi:RNA-binding protein
VHWPTRENVADRPDKTLQSGTRRGSVRTSRSNSTLILDALPRAMSDRLTSRQRAHLRSLAHDQDPLVHIGKEGLTDAVEQSVEEAFNTRELVTIRVLDNAPRDVRAVAEAVATGLDDVQVVRTIGSTALLYRPHPDEPEITLPDPGGE